MAGFFSRYTQVLARLFGTASIYKPDDWDYRRLYEMFEWYYNQNSLYEIIGEQGKAYLDAYKRMSESRNPAFAAVEFYPKTIWPGALPKALPIIVANGNDDVRKGIERVWKWSNWGQRKQVAARYAALYGDLFLKVNVRTDANKRGTGVSIQVVNPKYITDFKKDERGFVTYLRYDVCLTADPEKPYELPKWHTEVWDDTGYRGWEHTLGNSVKISGLGEATKKYSMQDMRLDFLPWVHVPFIAIDGIQSTDARGLNVFFNCMSKIDKIALKSFRLDQLLFEHNRPHKQIRANAMTPDGRPMAPPTFLQKLRNGMNSDMVLNLNGEDVYHMPGNSFIEYLDTKINYEVHMQEIKDCLEAIKTDLPELRYYEATELANESGIAVLAKLSPAIDRALEVRGNLESGLIQADQMALSLAIAWEVPGFDMNLGDYHNGDFEHSFKERPVFQGSPDDTANIVSKYTQAGMPITTAMREFGGWDATQIESLRQDKIDAVVDEAGTTTGPSSPPMEQSLTKAATVEKVTTALEPRIAAVIQRTTELAFKAYDETFRKDLQ